MEALLGLIMFITNPPSCCEDKVRMMAFRSDILVQTFMIHTKQYYILYCLIMRFII